MTAQEIFDKVAAHLLQQGKRSMLLTDEYEPVCAYRGEGGRMCAVGCLIKDENYTKELEGHGIGSIQVLEALEASGVVFSHELLLRELQIMHDTYRTTSWLECLRRIARDFDLTFKEPA